jgi:hypothetical protein
MGVLRSLSRKKRGNDNPYSKSMSRKIRWRADYPSPCFGSKDESCKRVRAFDNQRNHQGRHSSIKFFTPRQHHSGAGKATCNRQFEVYDVAHLATLTR